MDDLPPAIASDDSTAPSDGQLPGHHAAGLKNSPDWRDLVIAVAVIWSVELALSVALAVLTGGGDLARVPLALLAATLVSTAVTFTMVYVLGCAKYGRSLREGFHIRSVALGPVLSGAAIGGLGALGAAFILSGAPQGDSVMTRLMEEPVGLAVLATIALVLPPFEEVYFRGFLYPILARHLGGAWAVGIVALWFGIAHVGQLAGSWIGIPVVFTMGLLWTLMRHKTGSLVPSLVSHMTYNLILVLLSLATM
ncbi:MAG: CPBP family intramembrane glutamic endopeptidase [Planctomycetota bacterium]